MRRHDELIDVDVEVDCSSGTYIRALARDVGAALEVGGHLTALRRTRVGRFGLEQARTLDASGRTARAEPDARRGLPAAVSAPTLTDEEADAVANGRALNPAAIDGVYAAYTVDGRVFGLLRDHGPRTKSVVVIRPATL